jgi:regulator of protease activity HflC (stomatin/prohibitin superfamily)
MRNIMIAVALSFVLFSCRVVRPGEVGIKSTFGRLGKSKTNGVFIYNPFVTKIVKFPVRTINREVNLNLPSKEGLTINSEISILYRLKSKMVKDIIQEIGPDYDKIITAVFRSAAADVSSRFYAKDMHSGERDKIEKEIAAKMNSILVPKGFEIEAVLLKAITLPAGLSLAIEAKLKSEQEAQRMEFIKQQETFEADRKIIEAEGEKKSRIIQAQGEKEVAQIRAEGMAKAIAIEAEANAAAFKAMQPSLTPLIIQMRQVEAFKNLSTSPNTKVIITDGRTPLLGLPSDK